MWLANCLLDITNEMRKTAKIIPIWGIDVAYAFY